MNSVWAVVRYFDGHEKVMALYAKEGDALEHCAQATKDRDYRSVEYRARVFQIEHEFRRDR